MIQFALTFLLTSFALAATEKLSLSDALDRALHQNGELQAQRMQVLQSQSDIDRVSGEFGPHIEAMAGIGPITKATGNATVATEDKSSFGRTLLAKISVTEPLYTWGRKANYADAATAGVKVKEAEAASKEDEIRFQVKEAYFGYQLANSLRDFVAGGKEELQKALDKRAKKAKEDYRFEIFLREVDSREAEILKYYQLAQDGFALRVGESRGTVLPKNEWLLPRARQRKSVEDYLAVAREHRPEFRELNEGIKAKYNLAKAEKKAVLPVLAVFGSYEMADTNVRTPQPGVFAYDPYNRENWVLGVGFKMDFQWGLPSAKSSKNRAEAEELEAKQAFAIQGIETEVRKAYLELVEAETRLTAATEAYKTGKKWLTGVLMGYSSGLGGTQGLAEAYGARAETAKNYFDAVYRHHMAWATLSKVVGFEVDPAVNNL